MAPVIVQAVEGDPLDEVVMVRRSDIDAARVIDGLFRLESVPRSGEVPVLYVAVADDERAAYVLKLNTMVAP